MLRKPRCAKHKAAFKLAALTVALLNAQLFAARDNDEHRARRSAAARAAFVRTHPCPATGKTRGACPGYVVDHKIPLHCGGLDDPSNMQWQTIADGKAKDKLERDCRNSPLSK